MNILDQVEKLVKLIIKEKVAMPILAKVDKIDTKEYTCDCIELTNELEETKTIYTRVKIPRIWGAEKSGIWMSPSKGAIVLLNFLNGDRNYPIISAVMGSDQKEKAPENTLIIKCGETEIRLDDKIIIKAGGESLGDLLKDIAGNVADLKTFGSPTAQQIFPDQKTWWEQLKMTVLPKIFK